MLELGLRVTVSTDDPGVMGNRYLNEVMLDAAAYSSLDAAQLGRLGLNSLESAWTTVERRQAYLSRMASYLAQAS
jgi:adenosine deaminase